MPRSERIGYLVAVLVLVVGGAFFRSVILNWIVGPAIVVGSVVLCTRLLERFDVVVESDSSVPGGDGN